MWGEKPYPWSRNLHNLILFTNHKVNVCCKFPHVDLTHISWKSVQFERSPILEPTGRYPIYHAFTAKVIDLTDQTYLVQSLQCCYPYPSYNPFQSFKKVQPLNLVLNDSIHNLSYPESLWEEVLGAVLSVYTHTQLGLTLQGHEGFPKCYSSAHQCLFTISISPSESLLSRRKVKETGWLPLCSEKQVNKINRLFRCWRPNWKGSYWWN